MGSILPTIANHLCLTLHVPVNHFTKKTRRAQATTRFHWDGLGVVSDRKFQQT